MLVKFFVLQLFLKFISLESTRSLTPILILSLFFIHKTAELFSYDCRLVRDYIFKLSFNEAEEKCNRGCWHFINPSEKLIIL